MGADNRFVKLLTISIDKRELLLYGFSVSTEQEIRPWKKKKNKSNKLKLGVYFAILSSEEAKHFEQCLTETEDIPLKDWTLIAPILTTRNPVLSYSNSWEKSGPISRLSCVYEFWNTQKEVLIQKVHAGLGTLGKQLYLDMQELLAQLRVECGVDFSKNGSRFGNYESYDCPALICDLKVNCIKESEGKQIVVQKPTEWNRSLIVNCIAKNQERYLFNQIQVLRSEDFELRFTAEETIGQCTVCAWDQETHELVFFKSSVICNKIILGISIGETTRMVHDPWSETLLSSAANRSEVIHRQIETVQRYSSEHPIRIGRDGNSISEAADSGERLLALYTPKITQGAFIPNEQKDGEINSFLKIKKYLDSNDVCYAVLADPYFSVPSAAKLLARILNMNLELTIITSLGSIDPDSGEERNVVEEYRKFLQDNVGKLHERLYVCNLHRGKKQVFHDRYLIRYHTNGRIDGFLLSNSLNSMGQFYPFVIAPLETEVCRAVAEYLEQLRDPNIQNKQPKKQRVTCDVLFDFKQSVKPQNQTTKESADWASQCLQQKIAKTELSDVLKEIWSHWKEEPEEVCQVLSCLRAYSHSWTVADLAVLLQEKQFMAEEYMKCFSSMAKEIEQTRKHFGVNANRYEYIFWTLLTGKSKPDRGGFYQLLDYSPPVYYTGAQSNWLMGGYHLLLEMDIKRFVKLLEETYSPMMFYCLVEQLSIFSWSESLYYGLIRSKNECVRLLTVHWPGYLLERNKLEPDKIFQFLNKLEPDIQLLQVVQLLSKTAFKIRNPKTASSCWNTMLPQLQKYAATVLPLCTLESRQSALYWLYDCEACSCCSLYLELASLTENAVIQEELLSKAISIIKDDLLQCSYSRDVTQHISLYLDGMEHLYGEQAEKEMLSCFVDWNVFETAVEPELKSYAYKRWHDAYLRAGWQLDLLKAYLVRHPKAQDVIKWLNAWEKRLAMVKD